MLLIDQRFCITPPYSTARPGTLIRPTSVAAVICQEVSPAFSQLGASTGISLLRSQVYEPSVGARPGRHHVLPSSERCGLMYIGINRSRKHRGTRPGGPDVV